MQNMHRTSKTQPKNNLIQERAKDLDTPPKKINKWPISTGKMLNVTQSLRKCKSKPQ